MPKAIAITDVRTHAAARPSMSPIQIAPVSNPSLIHFVGSAQLDEPDEPDGPDGPDGPEAPPPPAGLFGLSPSAAFLATPSATSLADLSLPDRASPWPAPLSRRSLGHRRRSSRGPSLLSGCSPLPDGAGWPEP